MEAPQPVTEVPAQKNRTPLIIAAIAIVLCCGCLVVAVAAFYGFISIRSVETQVFPTEVFPPLVTQEVVTPASDSDFPTDTPGFDAGIGDPPPGGLGNDILKNETWQYVAAAAAGRGCDQPIGADSTIEVLQQPDANGAWLEKWTVACNTGDSYAFEVEFVLDATGATFNIKSLP